MLDNDTTFELMPFTSTTEDENAHQQSSSILHGMLPQWNSTGSNTSGTTGSFSSFEGSRIQWLWSQWLDMQHAITRRWQLLSQRRQKTLQIALVVVGVFLVVLTIESTVKNLHEKHVKKPTTTSEDWILNDNDDFHT